MINAPYILYVDSTNSCIYGFDDYSLFRHCGEFLNRFFIGKSIPSDWIIPKHNLDFPKKKLKDFILGYSQAPFVSEIVKNAINENFEGLVEFHWIGKIKEKDYFVMNVVNLLDCLDLKQSEINWGSDGDEILGIRKFVFRDEMRQIIQNTPVFKVPQHPFPIFVNNQFVELVRQYNFTGIGFEDPNNQGVSQRKCIFEDLPLR